MTCRQLLQKIVMLIRKRFILHFHEKRFDYTQATEFMIYDTAPI